MLLSPIATCLEQQYASIVSLMENILKKAGFPNPCFSRNGNTFGVSPFYETCNYFSNLSFFCRTAIEGLAHCRPLLNDPSLLGNRLLDFFISLLFDNLNQICQFSAGSQEQLFRQQFFHLIEEGNS